MVRTARDRPPPPACSPLFSADLTVLPAGLLAVPSLGPPALVSGMTWGRGVFPPDVPCSSRLKGNPREGAVDTGNRGPPHPIHARAPATSSLPAFSPRLVSHTQHPDAGPSASEAWPPSAAGTPTWACRAPEDLRMQVPCPKPAVQVPPVSPPPRPPLNTGHLGPGSPAPSHSELQPLCGPFPGASLKPSALSCPFARQTRCRLDWEQPPNTQHRAAGPGVFL